MLIWLAALAVALALARAAGLSGAMVALNYNEGWNAFHGQAAMTGAALYPQPPSLMTNNYPPLSFFVVGLMGRLTGDLIVAGRIVSLLSTLIAGWAVYAIARRMALGAMLAVFAAVLFLGKLLAASSYIGIDDPQMLGHALGCLGFLCVISGVESTRRLALGALLLTCALFVKQMFVIQPLALLIWLALTNPRSAVQFAGFGVVFCAIGLGISHVTGFDPIATLLTARSYALDWVLQSARDFLLVSFAPLAAGLYMLRKGHVRKEQGFALLCGIYMALALVIGLYFSGGAGVGRNGLFDAAIAGALSAGLLAQTLRPTRAVLFALACLVPLGIAGAERAAKPDPATRETATREDIAFLESRPGPALCEFLSYCYWAGKAGEVDAFNTVETIEAGARDEADITRLLDAKAFATIQLEHTSRFADLPAFQAALQRNYRVAAQSPNGVFWVPILAPSATLTRD